jgi:DGQHR domain-containing protein
MPKKKKKPLSAEERKKRARERAFKRQARLIFTKSGFSRIPETSDKEFTFEGSTSDFDDVFVHENLIVFCEYTLSNESGTGEHFKNKAHLYKKIYDDPKAFMQFYRDKFPEVSAAIAGSYHKDQLRIRVVYFSDHELKAEHAGLEERVTAAPRGVMQYFRSLVDAVERSARFEIFHWLAIDPAEVGEGGSIGDQGGEAPYPGSLLPEAHSEFPDGFKLVSFYVTPKALLRRAYVLRNDGWRDPEGLYQRMIDKPKIRAIRTYLKDQKRVFVNNVVVTLPADTRLDDMNGNDISVSSIDTTTPIKIKLRDRPNSVGVIDGQHRIFAYFEGINDDPAIAVFRDRQNMLATGIIYPPSTSDSDKQKFEAQLFLEINSNQNSAKSDLKQAIQVITNPYSDDSLGKRIVGRLARQGPLEGLLQKNYFETNVLKTSSIVSFALSRLVRIGGDESLLALTSPTLRAKVTARDDLDALADYVAFCVTELTKFLGAAKASIGTEKWALRTKKGPGVLSVTSVNALIILFRKVVVRDGFSDFEKYKERLSGLGGFKFGNYHSSQYNRMSDALLKNVYDASAT